MKWTERNSYKLLIIREKGIKKDTLTNRPGEIHILLMSIRTRYQERQSNK